jgi:hypothetical protein
MISANRIKYNGVFSNELNMPDMITCVAMDSDNGETSTYLNREAVVSETYDGRYKKISNFKYTETFAPKFSFFKKDLGDFTMDEVRIVLKWLTSKDTTALLETYYDDSNVVSWASIGGWTEIQMHKIANNRTIAITAVWDSISPFAFSDLYTVTKTITATDNKITINIDTDDNKPVYPRVTIQTSSADVKFVNKHTDLLNNSKSYSSLELANNNSGEKIIVDGANKIISSSSTKRIFGDDFNWVWLELYDGKNELTIEGNCTVTIEYREVRKIGEY